MLMLLLFICLVQLHLISLKFDQALPKPVTCPNLTPVSGLCQYIHDLNRSEWTQACAYTTADAIVCNHQAIIVIKLTLFPAPCFILVNFLPVLLLHRTFCYSVLLMFIDLLFLIVTLYHHSCFLFGLSFCHDSDLCCYLYFFALPHVFVLSTKPCVGCQFGTCHFVYQDQNSQSSLLPLAVSCIYFHRHTPYLVTIKPI